MLRGEVVRDNAMSPDWCRSKCAGYLYFGLQVPVFELPLVYLVSFLFFILCFILLTQLLYSIQSWGFTYAQIKCQIQFCLPLFVNSLLLSFSKWLFDNREFVSQLCLSIGRNGVLLWEYTARAWHSYQNRGLWMQQHMPWWFIKVLWRPLQIEPLPSPGRRWVCNSIAA